MLVYIWCVCAAFLSCLPRRQSHTVKVKSDDDNETPCTQDDDIANCGYLYARPELAYHVLSSGFFGFVAVTTLRFKYLWTPQMCILAAVGIADRQSVQWLLSFVGIKSVKVVGVLYSFIYCIYFSSLFCQMQQPEVGNALAQS